MWDCFLPHRQRHRCCHRCVCVCVRMNAAGAAHGRHRRLRRRSTRGTYLPTRPASASLPSLRLRPLPRPRLVGDEAMFVPPHAPLTLTLTLPPTPPRPYTHPHSHPRLHTNHTTSLLSGVPGQPLADLRRASAAAAGVRRDHEGGSPHLTLAFLRFPHAHPYTSPYHTT